MLWAGKDPAVLWQGGWQISCNAYLHLSDSCACKWLWTSKIASEWLLVLFALQLVTTGMGHSHCRGMRFRQDSLKVFQVGLVPPKGQNGSAGGEKRSRGWRTGVERKADGKRQGPPGWLWNGCVV